MKTLAKASATLLLALCLSPVAGRGSILEVDAKAASRVTGMAEPFKCDCGCYSEGNTDCVPGNFSVTNTIDCGSYAIDTNGNCYTLVPGGAATYQKITKNVGKDVSGVGPKNKDGSDANGKTAATGTKPCVIVTTYQCAPKTDPKTKKTSCSNTNGKDQPYGDQVVGACDAC